MADTKPSAEDLQKQVDELKRQLEQAKSAPGGPSASYGPNGEHDLDQYKDGEFALRGTGEKFRLKVVEDDPQGKRFHLKNKEKSFWAADVNELRASFDGDFSKFEKPAPDPKK